MKDYVTGFRKRKQQRRVKAQKQLVRKEKEDIRERRREKRQAIKDLITDCGLDSSSESEDKPADAAKDAETQMSYGDERANVTVTVAPMGENSSSSSALSGQKPSSSEKMHDCTIMSRLIELANESETQMSRRSERSGP